MGERSSERAVHKPPGSLLFTLANGLTLLFGLGHAGGVLQTMLLIRPSAANRGDAKIDELRELFSRLDAYQTPSLLGFRASMLDLRSFFNVAFSVLLISIFATNLAALRCASGRRDAIIRLSIVHGVSMLMLAGLSLKFSIAQGIVTATLITLLFAAAALRAKLCQATLKSTSH